jgi:CheY-like chemotaxis protein
MGKLILVVEDDLAIRDSLRELLEDEGYRVVDAVHGGEAIERLEAELPSLILLDLWMPVMTGGQLLERLRSDPRWSRIPVVLLSAASDISIAEGVVESLKKPVRLDVLLKTVARYLGA